MALVGRPKVKRMSGTGGYVNGISMPDQESVMAVGLK